MPDPTELNESGSETNDTTEESQPPTEVPSSVTPFAESEHETLRGKTPEEVEALFKQYEDALVQYIQQPPQPQQPQQPVQEQQQYMAMPDDELMHTDPKAWQEQLAQQIRAQAAQDTLQAAVPLVQGQDQLSRQASMNGVHKEIWANPAYAAEIDAAVSQIPAHMRTVALYDTAAQQVKGKHFDEIVAKERAQWQARQPDETAGTDTFTSPKGTTVRGDDDLWSKVSASPIGRQAMQDMSKAELLRMAEEAAPAFGITAKQYLERMGELKDVQMTHGGGRWNHNLSLEETS
ncbi:MAG: hypothetical protein R3268_00765 [Acidiferrobacterales bacterium]|nr:hypothetical protein [Acidiferrobacterales bacterium]